MAGCGKICNGGYKVEGEPLRCGTNLFWKAPGSDKARQLEVILCDACKALEKVTA